MQQNIPIEFQPDDYRYFDTASGVRLAYLDSDPDSEKEAMLFLHEFAGFSYTWERMLSHMPRNYRYIRLDCNGFGYSIQEGGNGFSPYDQAELITRFIIDMDLASLTLVGHGMGGNIALLLLHNPLVRVRVKNLILISCAALDSKVPAFIENIARTRITGRLLRLVHSKLIAKMILEYAYGDPQKLSPDTVDAYAKMLRCPSRIETLIRAAQNYRLPVELPSGLQLPALLIYGEKDPLLNRESIVPLQKILTPANCRILPASGHFPQEDAPEETASLITAMLDGDTLKLCDTQVLHLPSEETPMEPPNSYTLRMTRLFDYWNVGTILFIFILKILQFFKKLGVKAEKHGWRKITGMFLRNEYSKFILATFRLSYCSPFGAPPTLPAARELLTSRLTEFLLSQKDLHWSVEPRLLYVGRRPLKCCDLMEATLDEDGNILRIRPHFDDRYPPLSLLTQEQIDMTLAQAAAVYNRLRSEKVSRRPVMIAKHLKQWAAQVGGFRFSTRSKYNQLIDRIMCATFLYSDVLPADKQELLFRRCKTPDLRKYRHPGWGMNCIVARFTADFSEVDLWWQFNHVTSDGAPMQDILSTLKRSWGAAGNPVFPPLNGLISRPATMYCGDSIFRARFYVDFQSIMKIRKYLNANYLNEMNGTASLAGLLMWGLTDHDFFKNQKMLLPVDFYDDKHNRELGLLIIRPDAFDNDAKPNPLKSFLRFQREMNLRLADIRFGRSESHEFMTLATMLHPFFCHLMRYIAPTSLNEVVGTMGISIIRDAEVFVSPLTDFQSKGFMSLGSVQIPTADGRKAGSICICGSRAQIHSYFEAIRNLVLHMPDMLKLPSDWDY